ncbi:MAG: hypothetical protein KJ587_06560 [Alphaproteobacteria bacterium]|nr:hypothetical protein [Alphaproteobacteria bacterium]
MARYQNTKSSKRESKLPAFIAYLVAKKPYDKSLRRPQGLEGKCGPRTAIQSVLAGRVPRRR